MHKKCFKMWIIFSVDISKNRLYRMH